MQTTLAQFNETTATDAFALQNPRLLRVRLSDGDVLARSGCVVARQGGVGMEAAKGGLAVLSGAGDAFVSDDAHDLHLVYLEDDGLTVNARNLLAFDARLTWETERVGAVAATTLRGTGWLAIATAGPPVLADVAAAPTVVAGHAATAWASGVTADAADGGGPGELAFSGDGWVLVQPSGGRPRSDESASFGKVLA